MPDRQTLLGNCWQVATGPLSSAQFASTYVRESNGSPRCGTGE